MAQSGWTRRNVLEAAGAGAAAVAVLGGTSPRPARAATGPSLVGWKAASAAAIDPPSPEAHVLNRITFGATAADFERIGSLGIDGFIEEQLDPETLDDSVVEAAIGEAFPTLQLGAGELFELEKPEVVIDLRAAAVFRAISSRRQLLELMVDFWTNHLNIYQLDGACAFLKTPDDRDVIRAHALGSFRDLLHASSKSPAMLFYLDNYVNFKGGPNENYARELMELHTLGVEAGYTQTDVEEVARCFTGWTLDRRDRGEFKFVPQLHDDGAKTVLGFPIAAGGGITDGEQVIDLLAGHPSTARFVAYKLCRRFVADEPDEDLVDDAAATFQATDGDLKEVMRTILLSAQFMVSADAKLKRPLEFVCSAARVLEAEIDTTRLGSLLSNLSLLGQLPFDWHAPNGYPDVAGAWLNTNGLLNRWNFGLALAGGRLRGAESNLVDDLVGDSQLSAPEIVDLLTERLLHREIDPADRQLLITYLTGEGGLEFTPMPLPTPHPWPGKSKMLQQKIPGLVALILDSPYFQWR